MNKIVVPLSKTKLSLLLIGSIGFVVAGAWLWHVADTEQFPLAAWKIKVVSLAGILFFGLCAIYGCIKVFDSRPGLIIDDEGLVDQASGVSAGRVPWAEITGLKVSTVAGQRFIVIEVATPQKYVDRGNFLQRKLNAANLKLMGSPINISANTLRMKFDELERLMKTAYERYK